MNESQIRKAQRELDAAWDSAFSMNLSRLDALCAEICADLEVELYDVPTWEQLAPFYEEVR